MKTRSVLVSLICRISAIAATFLIIFSSFPGNQPHAEAAPAQASRFIAIVYDDSGSMRLDNKGNQIKNYIYANYSLQNLVALMEPRDTAKVYLFTEKGERPVTVTRKKDLYNAMKGIGAKPDGNTYAQTVEAAMADGARFLSDHPEGELLFVMLTDGASMDDSHGAAIPQLTQVFESYLNSSGLGAIQGRARALLLSIGTNQILKPVADLQIVLEHTGIPTSVFIADVTDEAVAGDHIMSSMIDLAEAMASTNMMVIDPGKPFTIRYPLESLAIMEQFHQSRESTIKSIEGGGAKLSRETLFATKAIGGIKLASTFSTVKSAKGSIKPGQYMIRTNGDTKLMAFSRVGFTTSVLLMDSGGNVVASCSDGHWSVEKLTLMVGDKLTAKVTFRALDGSSVEVDAHVKMSFGQTPSLSCNTTGTGSFRVEAVKPGREYIAVTLEDPDFFQIALPALPIDVPEPESSASPSPSPRNMASTAPNGNETPAATAKIGNDVLDGQDAHDAQYHVMAVPYTSSGEFVKAGTMLLGGATLGDTSITFKGIPDGMQVRLNGVAFDGVNASGAVTITKENNLELWVNEAFAATGKQSIMVMLGEGQALTVNYEAKPRQVKIELNPAALSFGLMEGSERIPLCGYRVYLMENGQWVELASSAIVAVRLSSPGGLTAALDADAQAVRVGSAWLPVLTPVGKSNLMLSAGTGKPGETASTAIEVTVSDDWRKWIAPATGLIVLLLLSAYVVKLAIKRRIPMNTEAYVADMADFSDARPAQMVRHSFRRVFWPFGRESCMVGPLELYAHNKRTDKALLSNMAVQYGLTLNGKPPQFHKDRDEAGDFVLTSDTAVGVRVEGQQRYYRFIFPGVRKNKLTRSGEILEK